MGERKFDKSFMTPSRLPVAQRYLRSGGRGRLFALGGVAALGAAVIFVGAMFAGRPALISGGALSASHALFTDDCGACHSPGEGVTDAKCTACHERFGGDRGAYGLDRHYLYRSSDYDRSAPSSLEPACATCHAEHEGRRASLLPVADAQCQACHEFGSFGDGHPEFAFAASEEPDRANLLFPHVLHVREVLDDRGLDDMEAACVQCHEPQPGGASFGSISFDRHCDDCHMGSSAATPFLPVEGATSGPGVQPLAAIRRGAEPGSEWAGYMSPSEFQEGGGQVRKRPVYHEDPWILHNLKLLRRQLYPGSELADLLRTSADVSAADRRTLHEEAVGELRARLRALRGQPSPSVQSELRELEGLLATVERRLEDPLAPLDETRFDVSAAQRSDSVPGDAEEYASLVESLTAPCQECHVIDRATVGRVQTAQRTMDRAEFDHRAHVIHARCLDCHDSIPFQEYLSSPDDPAAELDRASIQNLPAIATCRECHRERAGASTECTSCHVFHPSSGATP